jgi:hypothetical protein
VQSFKGYAENSHPIRLNFRNLHNQGNHKGVIYSSHISLPLWRHA